MNNKRIINFIRCIIPVGLILGIMLSIIPNTAIKNKTYKSIFELPEEFYDVYPARLYNDYETFNLKDEGRIDETKCNFITESEELIIACYKAHFLSDKEALKIAESRMQDIADIFHKYGYIPRQKSQIQDYDTGWRTSMDVPSFALSAQMLFEITNNTKYRDLVEEFAEYSVKNVSEKGFNIDLGLDSIWPLEFADDYSTPNNTLRVLNGSMCGYDALLALNKVRPDLNLDKYLEKVLNAYKRSFSNYHYKNINWSYYMLNPRTVVPIHYMIYEMRLMDCAYSFTGEKIFKQERDFRKKCLGQSLQVEFREDKEGNIQFFMNRACAPDLSLIDCYNTTIEFLDADKNVIGKITSEQVPNTWTSLQRFQKAALLSGSLKVKPSYYRVYASDYMLFEQKADIKTSNEDLKMKVIPFKQKGAIYNDDSYYVSLKFLPFNKNARIIALELTISGTPRNQNYIELYDTLGQQVKRYSPELQEGKNLIPFNIRGFVNSDMLININFMHLNLPFFSKDAKVAVDRILLFDSIESYSKYLENTDYIVNGTI